MMFDNSFIALGILSIFIFCSNPVEAEVSEKVFISDHSYQRVDEAIGCDSNLSKDESINKLNEVYIRNKAAVFKWRGDVIGTQRISGVTILALDMDKNSLTTEMYLKVGDLDGTELIGKVFEDYFLMVGLVSVKPFRKGACDFAYIGDIL